LDGEAIASRGRLRKLILGPVTLLRLLQKAIQIELAIVRSIFVEQFLHTTGYQSDKHLDRFLTIVAERVTSSSWHTNEVAGRMPH
jgi:hypothetical protein